MKHRLVNIAGTVEGTAAAGSWLLMQILPRGCLPLSQLLPCLPVLFRLWARGASVPVLSPGVLEQAYTSHFPNAKAVLYFLEPPIVPKPFHSILTCYSQNNTALGP